MRVLVIVLGLLATGLGVGSRFWPLVDQVHVIGNARYSREQILWLANLDAGSPLLWVSRGSLSGLERDPWIARSSVVRHWPDTVSITVWEREPFMTDGEQVWSHDGVLLPDVDPAVREGLPLVAGWGEPRTAELVRLLDLLSDRAPEVISYTPDGFDIIIGEARIFTPSVAALEAQWAAVRDVSGGQVSVYPWGVSESNE